MIMPGWEKLLYCPNKQAAEIVIARHVNELFNAHCLLDKNCALVG